ncbi:hypothetical protein [Dielma fastidiosa]|uniref:Neutral/alkaline ceramidase-like enzyme n=1 Tax=Dielma fastidiosa TaxID=1034346 RepID=A0AB35UNG7_9FIRM|nr:hypothetical protein [Dielma fastidiosa]MDY5166659.1 hypothetical protein [Dielma fastidiosa]
MRAGYAREIINPFYPCKMEGYNEARFCFNQSEEQKAASGEGLRTAYGQRDDLLMDVLCIEAKTMLVFIQLDICIVEREFADFCREALSCEFHLRREQISIACSHTHNSPVVSHGMAYDLKPDLKYWELIRNKMILALRQAISKLEDVSVCLDQHTVTGYYNNRNRPNDEYYRYCDEIRISAGNKPIVKILNLACHPTILGAQNMLISADFFGVMRRCLQGNDGYPVMIFNGEAGDSSPRLLKKGVDWQECIRYGEGIADQLMKPCAQRMVEVDEVDVKEIVYHIDYEPQKNAYLLNQKQKLEAELETLSPESDRYHRIDTCYLYDVKDKLKKDHIHYETLSYIYDFKAFRIVCVPCEIDTVLGARLRYADEKPTYLCAYSNGFHYYAVNKDEYGIVFESYNTYFPYGAADEMVDMILREYK